MSTTPGNTDEQSPVAGIAEALGLPYLVEAILRELPLEPFGHVTDCGYDVGGDCPCSTLPQRLADAIAAHAPAPAGRVCSQCGERDSAMVKIGTADGWCTVCLDEAAGS